ncbi:MAG: hypothetical protein J5509_05130 [Lachnospiraceae bacterium]|nr:hypothetical protein [Lachnospiraceae bacterium]
MNETEQKRIKTIYWILFAVLTAAVLPLWYLGRYDVICLDDFGFGAITHMAWVYTHSVIYVLQAAIKQVQYLFFVKQATYSSIFLMAFFPGIWNEKYYFLVPFILTSTMIGAVTSIVHVIIGDCVGVKDRYVSGIINILLIFLIIQTVPVPLEAFFWFNGSLHYMFMHSMMLFEAAIILHGIHSEKKSTRIWCIVGASLLGVVVGGGNLITGLQACILIFFHVIYLIRGRREAENKNKNLIFLIPELVTVAGYMVNILAPGNHQRMGVETQMNPIKAIILSFYWGAAHGISWISPMMIAVMAIVAVLCVTLVRRSGKKFLHPLFLLAVSICIFAAMFTPTFYATSEDAPARVKNVIYLSEVLLIFINIINDAGYVYTNVSEEKPGILTFWKNLFELMTSHIVPVVLTGIIAVSLIFVFAEDKNTYTSMSAVRSIANGEAERYYDQMKERAALYNDPEIKNVTIYALTDDAKPYLLFKEDVGNSEGDEGYWQNVSLCNYYEKYSITVVER